jgi:hypothetical protein
MLLSVLEQMPKTFVALRHMAFNLLKRHPADLSLKRKRNKASLSYHFLRPDFSSLMRLH